MSEVYRVSNSFQKVGKRISFTKVRHTWEFVVGGESYTLGFVDSKSSGKARVFLNQRMIFETTRKNDEDFIFTIELHSHKISLEQPKGTSTWTFKIGDDVFQSLKQSVVGSQHSGQDFRVTRNQNNSLKISSELQASREVQAANEYGIFEDPQQPLFANRFSEVMLYDFTKIYQIQEENDDPQLISMINNTRK